MMSCMLIMVVCICYLCHWRFQKVEERYGRADSWIQVSNSEPPLHIFTLEQECYGGLYEEGESYEVPPPDYETVMGGLKEEQDDPDLPSYEAALKLSGNGYL